MKNKTWFYPFIIVMGLLCLAGLCTKEEDEIEDKIIDKDGNVYASVTIGTQEWMVENLKTTKYSDGTDIPLVTENSAWGLPAPAYCWYDNDASTYKDTYGALYNWHAVGTGKLCPSGWHIPSDEEWTTLTDFLGGEDVAGGKLKEAGTTHWNSPNIGGSNDYGFAALPGGNRAYYQGLFDNIGHSGIWWSSSYYNSYYSSFAWFRSISNDKSKMRRADNYKLYGFSVRCVKD